LTPGDASGSEEEEDDEGEEKKLSELMGNEVIELVNALFPFPRRKTPRWFMISC